MDTIKLTPNSHKTAYRCVRKFAERLGVSVTPTDIEDIASNAILRCVKSGQWYIPLNAYRALRKYQYDKYLHTLTHSPGMRYVWQYPDSEYITPTLPVKLGRHTTVETFKLPDDRTIDGVAYPKDTTFHLVKLKGLKRTRLEPPTDTDIANGITLVRSYYGGYSKPESYTRRSDDTESVLAGYPNAKLRQIFALLGEGYTRSEVCEMLGVSKFKLSRMLRKAYAEIAGNE